MFAVAEDLAGNEQRHAGEFGRLDREMDALLRTNAREHECEAAFGVPAGKDVHRYAVFDRCKQPFRHRAGRVLRP